MPVTDVALWTDHKVKVQLARLDKVLARFPVYEALVAQTKSLNKRARLKAYAKTLSRLQKIEADRKKYKNNSSPVGVREFLTSKKYMDKASVLWPKVIDEIEEACSGKFVEGVFTGGIGCAKTTAALYVQAYLLYQLSCMKDPHAEFGLDPASEIMIVFQSLNATTAQTVEFDRFKEMIDSSPYFRRHFPYDRALKSSMHFPSRIIVKPLSGSDKAAIGQNVISGIIDEVNFMAVIEKSKAAIDGGEYNQAIELYNSIVRRRESRFMVKGRVWGLLCLVSSARYRGQFTDKRKEAHTREVAEHGRSTIYIYDKRAWEVMDEKSPTYSYSGKTFRLFIGDMTRKPRYIAKDEKIDAGDKHLVMTVPIEHKHAFDDDMYDAIRDIAGMPTMSLHPFMTSPEKVALAFGKVLSIFSRTECDFDKTSVSIYPKRFRNLKMPRYVHVDLSKSSDSTGIAIGHVTGFTSIERSEGESEILPVIEYDALLEVYPPSGGEINFAKIRGMLYKLKSLGLPIKWVSLDGYNSVDFIQIVRQKGFIAGNVSMDTTPVPYEILKQALVDERVRCPEHDKCQHELVTLERDPKNGKIDHPAVSSKDVSDAMAGVAYGLTMRREIWAMHKVRPDLVPKSIIESLQQGKNAVEGGVGDVAHAG